MRARSSSDGVPPIGRRGRPTCRDHLRASRGSSPRPTRSRRRVCLTRDLDLGRDACSGRRAGRRRTSATTSATRSRFGHSACSSSSAALDVGAAWQLMAVLGPRCPGPTAARRGPARSRTRWRRGSASTARIMLFEPSDRPHHLERELRNAVAEIGERQALEHDVGEAAIGRRVVGALLARRSADRASGPRRRDGRASSAPRDRAACRRPRSGRRGRSRPRTGRPRNWRNRRRSSCRSCRPPPPPLPPLAVRSTVCSTDLLELRRPDHLAARAARGRRPAGSARPRSRPARRVLRRGPSTFAARGAAEQRPVDGVAGDRAEDAPGDRADGPADRDSPPERPSADRGGGGGGGSTRGWPCRRCHRHRILWSRNDGNRWPLTGGRASLAEEPSSGARAPRRQPDGDPARRRRRCRRAPPSRRAGRGCGRAPSRHGCRTVVWRENARGDTVIRRIRRCG